MAQIMLYFKLLSYICTMHAIMCIGMIRPIGEQGEPLRPAAKRIGPVLQGRDDPALSFLTVS